MAHNFCVFFEYTGCEHVFLSHMFAGEVVKIVEKYARMMSEKDGVSWS